MPKDFERTKAQFIREVSKECLVSERSMIPSRTRDSSVIQEIVEKGLDEVSSFSDILLPRERLLRVKASGKKRKIAKAERESIDSIQEQMEDTFGYESGCATPADIKEKRTFNCVGSTLVGGDALGKLEITYALGSASRHVVTLVATSDARLLWYDFLKSGPRVQLTDTDFLGETSEGDALGVQDVVQWIHEPTDDGLLVSFASDVYRRLVPAIKRPNDPRNYLVLAAPEYGHQTNIIQFVGAKLYAQGLYEESLYAYEYCQSLAPKDPLHYFNTSSCNLALGDYTAAMDSIEQGLSLGIEEGYLYDKKGEILSQMGDYEGSLPWQAHAIELEPDNARWWNNRGTLWKKLDNLPAAEQDYFFAVRLAPEEELYRKNLEITQEARRNI